MNLAAIAQFSLIESLLSHWDEIRVRMGDYSPATESEMSKIAQALATADQPERLAVAIDRLLDLACDTEANAYVAELIRRAALPGPLQTRSSRGAADLPELDAQGFETSASVARRRLASTVGATVGFKDVVVHFATNRGPAATPGADSAFGVANIAGVTLGRISMTIPSLHKSGKIEQPWLGSPDRKKHFVLETPQILHKTEFLTGLTQGLESAARKELLIFLHGYNTTFEEAARRAGQIKEDMGFEGAVILFSWPSAGALLGYLADEDRAATSAGPLKDFLASLEHGPWERVHLLAHSMGNRVLLGGLARSAKLALPLRNVVFAAADVYVDAFKQDFPAALAGMSGANPLFTSYASRGDLALKLSALLHNGPRVGRVDGDRPFTYPGVQTIDATDADPSLLGLHHGYFGERPYVLSDIAYMIEKGLAAPDRVLKAQDDWWRLG